jgi:hypothetical protein
MEKLNNLKKESERFRLIGSVFYLHAPEGVADLNWLHVPKSYLAYQ